MKEIDLVSNSTTSSANHISTRFLEPTRYGEGNTPSLLDLILTNEEGMVNNILYEPDLGKSDHIIIKFDFICYASMPITNIHTCNRLNI